MNGLCFCICQACIRNSTSLTSQATGSSLKIVTFINILFPITLLLSVLILPPSNQQFTPCGDHQTSLSVD